MNFWNFYFHIHLPLPWKTLRMSFNWFQSSFKRKQNYSVRKSVNTDSPVIGNVSTSTLLYLCVFRLLLSNTLEEKFFTCMQKNFFKLTRQRNSIHSLKLCLLIHENYIQGQNQCFQLKITHVIKKPFFLWFLKVMINCLQNNIEN